MSRKMHIDIRRNRLLLKKISKENFGRKAGKPRRKNILDFFLTLVYHMEQGNEGKE